MKKKSKHAVKAAVSPAQTASLKLRLRQALEQAQVAQAVAKDAKEKLKRAKKLAKVTRKEAKRLRKVAKQVQEEFAKATKPTKPAAAKSRPKTRKAAKAVRPPATPVLSPDPTPPTQEVPVESPANPVPASASPESGAGHDGSSL
jgi:hypothetical protein